MGYFFGDYFCSGPRNPELDWWLIVGRIVVFCLVLIAFVGAVETLLLISREGQELPTLPVIEIPHIPSEFRTRLVIDADTQEVYVEIPLDELEGWDG